jgi:dipeptidyl aminopeptidase/acylaminoacyl peptidase
MVNHLRRGSIVFLFVLGIAVWPVAADTFTPHHVARIRSVSAIAASPDGSAVAYTLVVPRRPLVDEDGPAWQELHVVSRDGVSRPFVSGDVSVGAVGWLPGGRVITFLAKRGTDTSRALYALPVDGGEARRVLAHAADIQAYSVSPDGKRVAFVAREAPAQKTRDLQRKGFNQEIFEETVLPGRLWVASLDEPEAAPRLLDVSGSVSGVLWSPMGNRLAVIVAPTPLVDDDLMMRRVQIVNPDEGTVVAKIDNPGKLGPIAWSPDGQWVALVSGADLNDPAAGRLFVARATGGTLRDVLPNYEGHVSAIAWRDFETIAFIGDEGVETVLGEAKYDARGRRTLVPGGERVLTALDASSDGRTLALAAEAPTHPREVFLLGTGDTSPRRLTDSNRWLAEMRLARQDVVKFKARDGLALEGILVRPLDEQPGTRYPLVLTVHGGPEAHDRNGWLTGYSNLGQVGAARGFAVFYPNYRGSTGRGVAFSKLGQGDAAGKEFDDLVDAVDHLVATGLVDRARVGITGGSYGGYASAWGATRLTDRFAASVAFVGISNKISKLGTTDIANEEFLVHARKQPWDDWKYYLERSPIYWTGQSKTPTLILGGTDDPRVHPSQSLELYRYLKLRGKAPVRLVRYPGEQHGNRRAASRLDYNLRLLQWMEHYLKGPGGDPPPYDLDYTEPKTDAGTR